MTSKLLIALLAILLSACSVPDIQLAGNCERLGVLETGVPIGELYSAKEMFQDELEAQCNRTVDEGETLSGCVQVVRNGQVAVYYRYDDPYAMNHELCHQRHGLAHTQAYLLAVRNGHPAPYQPEYAW